MGEITSGRRAVVRKEAKSKRKVARDKTRACWMCGKTSHIAAWFRKGRQQQIVLHR